jgi:DNA-binding response OmpR family regulator
MRILMIEDDNYKVQKVLEHLQKHKVDVKKSYNSGMRALLKEEYDAVILDMTFPTFDERSLPKPEMGLQVLREMKRKKITLPVLIHSGDEVDVSEYENIKGYILADNSCIQSRLHAFLDQLL